MKIRTPPTMWLGNVPFCERCGHFACVCDIRDAHTEDCKFRRAAASSVAIACEHDRDVCPICDPCTCTP